MKAAETVIEVGKWASIVSHVKNNRIEYLALTILAHLVGLTAKAQEHSSGLNHTPQNYAITLM